MSLLHLIIKSHKVFNCKVNPFIKNLPVFNLIYRSYNLFNSV